MSAGSPDVLKRTFDILISLALLVALGPLICASCLAVWLSMGRPVLYVQVRPGLYGRPFSLLKLRTMSDIRDADGKLLEGCDRVTALGRILRRLSIDELPQLWNVLRGDMSLVGPRPLRMEYWDRYSEEHRRRHDVRPGVTGWAQVRGRNNLPFSKRFELDLWYVHHRSVLLDAWIVLLTVSAVLQTRGAHVEERQEEVDDLGLEG